MCRECYEMTRFLEDGSQIANLFISIRYRGYLCSLKVYTRFYYSIIIIMIMMDSYEYVSDGRSLIEKERERKRDRERGSIVLDAYFKGWMKT